VTSRVAGCGDTIGAGERAVLNQTLENCNEFIAITLDGGELDCQGNAMIAISDRSYTGIEMTGSGSKIRNCVVSDFATCISMDINAEGLYTIVNTTATDCTIGFLAENSRAVSIENSRANENGIGIKFESTGNVGVYTLLDVDAKGNTESNIEFEGPMTVNMTNVEACFNPSRDIVNNGASVTSLSLTCDQSKVIINNGTNITCNNPCVA
jgi:hypothetical protein